MKKITLISILPLFCISAYSTVEKNKETIFDTTQIQWVSKDVDKLKIIRINKNVSTHFVLMEDMQYVDISSNDIVGDNPVPKIVRIKPLEDGASGVITIVTQKYLMQYMLLYDADMNNVVSRYTIPYSDVRSFLHNEQKMTPSQLYEYAQRMFISDKKFFDLSETSKKMRITINNIYTIDNYFFIDLTLYNKTAIKYDIDEIRFKIEDKRQLKSTNFQSIEIFPEIQLSDKKSFIKSFRNIYVFEKFTFPEDKVINIEVSEKQISGRAIGIQINYTDILKADQFIE